MITSSDLTKVMNRHKKDPCSTSPALEIPRLGIMLAGSYASLDSKLGTSGGWNRFEFHVGTRRAKYNSHVIETY